MPLYTVVSFPYAERHHVLERLDAAIAQWPITQGANPTLDGATEILVRVTPPQERLGTHTPTPEEARGCATKAIE
jgi:hypothetical protein